MNNKQNGDSLSTIYSLYWKRNCDFNKSFLFRNLKQKGH